MKLELNFSGFEQHFLLEGKKFIPKIYEGSMHPPAGFNTVLIPLDLSERSTLKWEQPIAHAEGCIEKGYLIVWEFEFGLSEGSLEDQAHFLSLQLGVQHFRESVWPLFKDHTLGIALFRGEISKEKEELILYLKLLAAALPEEVACFLFLDTEGISHVVDYFYFVNRSTFGHFHLIIKGPLAREFPYATPTLAWNQGGSPLGFCSSMIEPLAQELSTTYGLCLPQRGAQQEIQEVVDRLGRVPFKVISESLLTEEWDGIEHLIVFPTLLSESGRRKIRGFAASGGCIIKFPDDAASLLLQGISQPSYPASFR